MTPKLPPPAWMQGQKPAVALQEPEWERGTVSYDIDTEELFDDLDASLALIQAREVRTRLAAAHPELAGEDAIAIETIKTTGDLVLDRPLTEIGGSPCSSARR